MADANATELVRRPPKNKRVRRIMKKMEPKNIENPKTALFLKGRRSSQVINNVLRDLSLLKRPFSIMFTKHNEFYPFETMKNLEFLCFKNDTSLFCFGSHQKKRPHNIILGRMFNYHELDLLEMGVTKYIQGIGGKKGVGGTIGSKPLFCFLGSHWEANPGLKRVSNLILDFFRGKEVKSVNLAGIDRVICVMAKPKSNGDADLATGYNLLFRHYAVLMKKGEGGSPRVDLESVGPSIDFTIRRTRFSDSQTLQRACRIPRAIARMGKQKKNLSRDGMANIRGQLHVGKTELEKLPLRRYKAHEVAKKRDKAERKAAEQAAGGDAPEGGRKRKAGGGGGGGDEYSSGIDGKPTHRFKKDTEEKSFLAAARKKRKVK